ncbi:hypothetical protein [Nocardiopsis ganjiahuensis]|uniref:hypothetical protein n=1 Tax=Nocardiopsis ganjiahuensis TaxID=239984 RepID=UPI00034A0090|nr:hypothetical protein [Nocardiopsis ganjiahuensis]
MRRSLALASAVCLLAVTACDSSSDSSDGEPETVEELAEGGLVGLALVHRGFEAGDPETEQVLVFHDPGTGAPVQRIDLPDGALDPMAPAVPVHKQFSEDWQYFAFVTAEPNAVHLAVLTDPQEAGAEGADGEAGEGGEAGVFSYLPVESIPAGGDETLSAPAIHGDRLWFASAQGAGQPPQLMSVPLEAPAGTPSQEGSLALGEGQRPSDWTLTPDGSLHIRNSVPTEQVTGGEGNLVVRSTNGSVVNATLNTGGEQWQTFDDAPVWGGERALLRPDGTGEGGPNGAYLLEVEDQGHSATRLLEDEPSPVVQYALAPERDAILLQTEEKWFRVDLEDGAVTETAEAFPRYHDTSMDGWPLVVRWSQEPPADPDADPSESPGS